MNNQPIYKQGKTLYVSDMDGTLLGANSLVSARSSQIISSLSHNGSLITVATARTPATVVPLLEGTYTAVPAIVMTGAALWRRDIGGYADIHPHSPETVAVVLDKLAANGIEPFIYQFADNDPKLHVYRRLPLNAAEQTFMQIRRSLHLKQFHLDEPRPYGNVVIMLSIGDRERIYAIADDLRASGLCSVSAFADIFDPSVAYLELFAPGVSKAAAVQRLKMLTGANRVVVYGDNLNDLPMMAVADEAVAVGNAAPEVLEAADRIIGLNTDDAVALDIERLETACNH